MEGYKENNRCSEAAQREHNRSSEEMHKIEQIHKTRQEATKEVVGLGKEISKNVPWNWGWGRNRDQ